MSMAATLGNLCREVTSSGLRCLELWGRISSTWRVSRSRQCLFNALSVLPLVHHSRKHFVCLTMQSTTSGSSDPQSRDCSLRVASMRTVLTGTRLPQSRRSLKPARQVTEWGAFDSPQQATRLVTSFPELLRFTSICLLQNSGGLSANVNIFAVQSCLTPQSRETLKARGPWSPSFNWSPSCSRSSLFGGGAARSRILED